MSIEPTPSTPDGAATAATPRPPAPKRLFGGYGPLLGFTAMVVGLSLFVPTVRQEVLTKQAANVADSTTGPQGGSSGDATGTDVTGTTAAPSDTVAGDAGTTPGSTAPRATGSGTTAKAPSKGTTKSGAAGGAIPKASVTGVSACTDRTFQDPNDPYSPPCYAFNGDNGGATSPGVTKDTITIAVRSQTFSTGFSDALSVMAGAKFPKESQDVIDRTMNTLTDYFNSHYQFYGRKLKLVIYPGKGDLTQEIVSQGQEAAEADALKVQSEIKAFADVGAVTPPYADALTHRKIINIGAPYVSQDWLTSRSPYSWSVQTDCTRVVKSVAAYFLNKMANKPAIYAGGPLANQPRKIAVIAPDNSWYQECVNAGLDTLAKAGIPRDQIMVEAYRLDLNDMTPQAQTKLQKLLANNITTVICGCDPIFMVALGRKAKDQNYHPEWLETGVALTDSDLVGELIDQDVWNHAFGVSFLGPSENIQASFAYRAFKQMRPADEPSQAVQLMFPQLELAAIGIQMAGPNLTPDSFKLGLFNYPKRSGPLGTWKFDATSYTPSQAAREIWYDRNAISKQTKTKGAWIESNPGQRFPIGQFPGGDPKVG